MTTRDAAPLGAPCWADLATTDIAASRAFYGELFGWTSEAAEEFGGYVNFSRDGEMTVGAMETDGSMGPTNTWAVYLASADIDATCAAAAANGGSVVMAPMDVGDLGRMGYVAGPDGASVGIWQPGLHPGFLTIDEPNAPAWFELHTTGYDAAVEFYRAVFGWDTHVMSDTDEFRYTTLGEGDDALAGIMDSTGHLSEDAGAFWNLYFGVPDTDQAVVRVEALGGSVTMAPFDSPYGRMASVTDTTGAAFMIVGRG